MKAELSPNARRVLVARYLRRAADRRVTIYRSGSQSRQVLALGAGEDATSREFFAKCDPGACRL